MVNVGGEKMSKSLGNFTTIRALLESGTSAMTLRLFVLQAHYRKPLDFTAEALAAAATGWKGLNAALQLAAQLVTGAVDDGPDGPSNSLAEARLRFAAAMDDDLNTSAALAALFELAKPLRSLANRSERGDAQAASEAKALQAEARLLLELAGVLGLGPEVEADPAGAAAAGPSDAEIAAQIGARLAAKAAKNFGEADRIRASLLDQGIELIDKPGGLTDWLRS
jgi:cysteinyl-tRNA synthetase